ncbi:MAG: amino acid adenylation domain-containing protein [Cyanobacteria bacterium P01_F01_bin.150]
MVTTSVSASFPNSAGPNSFGSDAAENNSGNGIADLYELSPMQQGMVFHTLYAPESSVYFEQRYCRLQGPLEPSYFQQAWQAVVNHYPVLRTAFFLEEFEKPLQAVLSDVVLPWTYLDWRELGAERQSNKDLIAKVEANLETRLENYLEGDRAQGFVLDQAPLMRCTLIQLAEEDFIFVWSHHHALMDGWCNAQLLRDVMAVYDGLLQGRQVTLTPSPDYRNYILWLQQQNVDQAQTFWQQQLNGIIAPTQFRPPVSPYVLRTGSANTKGGRRGVDYFEYHASLSPSITQTLQEGCKHHHLTLNTLVQGAWSLLMSHYSGDNQVVFGATVSGRPPTLPQVESIIGLFINTLPVRVNLSPEAELVPWLQTLQIEQREREQYSYSSLVDIQACSDVLRGVSLFDSLIVFENYPMSIETVLKGWDSQLAIRDLKGFERTNYPLTLSIIPGESLSFRITYDGQWFSENNDSGFPISLLWGHLQTILTGFAEALTSDQSSHTLANISLLTDTEQRQQQEWAMVDSAQFFQNATEDAQYMRLVHEWVEKWAEETPDAVAIVFDSQSLTYQELNQQANQLAHHLLSVDVQLNELVGVCLERSSHMLIALLAVHKAGAAYVPIDPTYPQDRINYVIEDAGIKTLVQEFKSSRVQEFGGLGVQEFKGALQCINIDTDVIRRYPTSTPQLSNSLTLQLSNSPTPPPKSKIAYTIYTSGSTGKPKGVQIPHHALINFLQSMAEVPGFDAGDRLLAVTTPSFDIAGLELFLPLVCGGQIVIASQNDVRDGNRLKTLLNDHDITVMQATPATWRLLLANAWNGKSNLRILCGGEALDTPLAAELLGKSQSLWNMYGPTETTVWSLCHQVTAADVEGTAVPIGRAIANTDIKVLNQYQQPVPVGVPGELYIGGAGVAIGYLNRPELTVDRFVLDPGGQRSRGSIQTLARSKDDYKEPRDLIAESRSLDASISRFYKTGDRVRYRPDGTLEYLERLDFQIKLRGFRIELGEIEVALSHHPQVQQAVVVVQSQDTDPMLVAYFVPEGEVKAEFKAEGRRQKAEFKAEGRRQKAEAESLQLSNSSTPQLSNSSTPQLSNSPTPRSSPKTPKSKVQNLKPTELREFLAESLPAYMIPSIFMHLDALPLTPNGKVNRRALPVPTPASVAEKNTGTKTPTQEVVIALAAIALNQTTEGIGPQDNFFDLGGHSLSATRFASQVRQAFQVELPLRQVFEQPTFGTLANVIDELIRSEVDPASLQNITPERLEPLTPQPLSFAQQRQWMLWQLEPESATYNIPLAVKITGDLDLTLLQKSLEQVVMRHQVLRSRFDIDPNTNQPIQLVLPDLAIDIATVDLSVSSQTDLQESLEESIEERLLAIAREEANQPFDLTTPPLFRVKVAYLSESEQVLLLTLHHIIADGWSMGVLVHELTAFYRAQLANAEDTNLEAVLSELPIQYGDFARWQRQWLDGDSQGSDNQDKATQNEDDSENDALEQQLDYWRSHLDQAPTLDLPTTYPRPAVRSEHGDIYSFQLSDSQTQALKALSQQAGCTLFMTVFAAFNLFLHRYSGNADIVVGTPIANRHRAEVEPLIGFFVNTLALRTDLSGNPTLADLLGQVRDITLDGYAYQDLPFEQVLDALDVERSLAYTPLFQVMFSLENRVSMAQQQDLQWTPMEQHSGTAKFDLTVVMTETDEGLEGTWEYSLDLFDVATVKQMVACFQTLLDTMPSGLERPISDLLWLPSDQQQMVMDWGTQTATDYPRTACIYELFDAQANQQCDDIALTFPSESGADQWTYEELNKQANQLAHYFQYQGVGPDVLVGVWAERSPQTIIAILAILKAGGAYVPLEPDYPFERLHLMVEDARLSLIISANQNSKLKISPTETLSEQNSKLVHLNLNAVQNEISHYPITPPFRTTTPDNLAYVMYTSGSTGTPKGVCVTHRAVVRLVKNTNYVKLDNRQVILQAAPLAFDASTFELWGAFLNGGQVVMMPQAQPSLQDFGEVITRYNVTTVWLTAGLFHVMVDEAIANFASVQQVLAGGDVLSGPHLEKLLKTYPNCRVINGYGPTEGTTFTCCHAIALEDCNPSPPIGQPISNTQVYILDEYLQPVPAGLPGELYIAGDGLARGYLNRPGLTGDRFIPNPFLKAEGRRQKAEALKRSRGSTLVSGNGQKLLEEPRDLGANSLTLYKTGDRVRFCPDGAIEYLGRLDRQVKIRGFRVELGEVEALLCQHGMIRDAVVIMQTDDYGVDRLVAYVVGDSSERPDPRVLKEPWDLLTPEIRAFLGERVPDYLVPARVVWLEYLPLTGNGKVDRRALPVVDWSDGGDQRAGETKAQPQTDAEVQLVKIWQEVLHQSDIGIDDNFFALGGDSILAIQIVSRAHQAGLSLKPKQIFQYQTIAELTAFATIPPSNDSVTIADQGIVTGLVPLTPIQNWFFAQQHPQPNHFNQAVLLAVKEHLNVVKLEEAIAHLLTHHDNLRSRFIQSAEDGVWQHELLSPEQVNVSLKAIDAAGMPEDQWQALLSATVDNVHQSLKLSTGELLRVVWFDRGDSDQDDNQASHRLLIVVHHLVIDGVSWRILLEDLQTVYQQLCLGQPVQLPPKTTSIQAWATSLQGQISRVDVQVDKDQVVAKSETKEIQSLWDSADNGTVGTAQQASVALSAEQTQALLTDVPLAYGTGMDDVLLTALAGAIAESLDVPDFKVALEGYGRESEVDVSRTVGWFTTITPLILNTYHCRVGTAHQSNTSISSKIVDALKSIKEQIRQQKQATDASDPRVLEEPWDLNPADISFNYLGQLTIAGESKLLSRALESSGQAISSDAPRPYALEIVGSITSTPQRLNSSTPQLPNASTPQLTLSWTYNPQQISTEAIESLTETFKVALVDLIEHCCSPDAGGHTPSDFPLAPLTQPTLDTMLTRLNLKQVANIYPLSPMQQGMLFHSLFTPQAGMYAIQVAFDIYSASDQDTFDSAAFEQAWQQTVHCYNSFRTVFVWDGLEQPLQVVAKDARIPVQALDWSAMSVAEQQQRLVDLEKEERSRDFPLIQPPLMRLVVIQQSPKHHHIIWTYHHLLLDGWSMPLVLKEVLTAYQEKAEGRRQKAEDGTLQLPNSSTPQLAFQNLKSKIQNPYAAYISWLMRQDQCRAEEFWREYLAGFTAPTAFRFEASGAKAKQGRVPIANQSQQLCLSETLTQQLRDLCQQQQLTLNTVVQGAFALLLSRYSGETDVVFGATSSGRSPELAGSESMVGLMMNTLPLRVAVNEHQDVISWLQALQAQHIELQQYEFSSLIDIQRWSEVPRGTPLFESVVVFENYPVEATLKDNRSTLTVENVQISEQTNLPLSLYVVAEAQLTLNALFDPSWFGHDDSETTPPFIARLLGHLQTILESFAESATDTEVSIHDIELLTAVERQLLEDWNQTQLDVDLSPTAYVNQRFEAQVNKAPEAIALTTINPLSSQSQSLTYREVDQRANQLAHYLQSLDIQPGELVGVCVERSAEMVIALLAIHKAGAAYLPIDPTYPGDRIRYMVEDAGIRTIIQQSTTQIQNSKLTIQNSITLDTDQDTISHHPITPSPKSKIQNPKSEIAYTIYTSGSTGNPKGVQISHRSLANFLHAMQDKLQLSERDTLLAVTTLSFDIAALELFLPLMVGGTVAIAPRDMTRNGAQLAEALDQHQVTVMQATPMTWRLLLASGWQGKSDLRILSGGEALDSELARQLLDYGQELWNLYGPTETTIWSAAHKIERDDVVDKTGVMSIGQAIANTTFYVLDTQLRPVPVGIPGELYIGGEGVALGYLNRPDLTSERFVEHLVPRSRGSIQTLDSSKGDYREPWDLSASVPKLYKTGDRVRYQEDGTLEYLGRLDFQVKLRGFRIELGEIEAALSQHPDVQQTIVTVYSQEANSILVAYVILKADDHQAPKSGGPTPSPSQEGNWSAPTPQLLDSPTPQLPNKNPKSKIQNSLRQFLTDKLPQHLVPSRYMVLDALPLTPNGKVDRKRLPAPDGGLAVSTAYVAPKTSIEQAIAQVWQTVLKVETVGIHDNFFDLGGHSLLVVNVHNQLKQEDFGASLTLVDLFQYPTISDLANYLSREDGPTLEEQVDRRVEKMVAGRDRLKQRRQKRSGGRE